MRLSKRIRHTLVYNALRFLIWFFNLIPRRLAIGIGGALGSLVWRFMKRDRARIDANLQIAYGEKLRADERREIGRRFFINSGKNIVDVARIRKHLKTELLPLIEAEGREHLDAAFAQGNGVIGVTGHLGNFELLAAYLVSTGYPTAVIGKELYDPRIDAIVVGNRTASGLMQFYTTDSPKKIIGWLKNNGGLGVLMDTDSDKVRGTFVPFFGRLANTPVGQSMIALKTGSPVLPMCCVRTGDNRYKVIIRPIISITQVEEFERNVYTLTAACTKALEELIDAHRDQWIWLHQRWRSRPEEEK